MADISKIKATNGTTYDIKDATARTDIGSLETSVNAKLPLSGGTMTGAIYKKNSNVDLKETDNGVTSNTYDAPIMVRDKNNYNIGGIRGAAFTDGKTRGEIKAYNRKSDNTQVEAGFGVNIDKEGTVTYNVSTPAALLAAIDAAKESHAVNASTYGLGTTGVYGHVKTVNNVTTSAHANGLALSAYQGKVLKDAIDGKAPKNHAVTDTSYGKGTEFNWGHCQVINNLTFPEHIDGVALSAYQGNLLANGSARDSTKLAKSGGTMTGTLTMGTNPVYSASTLHLRGNSFLNLRSPGIQCRNAADSAWAGISASSFTNQSSERYKEKIMLANDDIANTVYGLDVKTYDYKENVVDEEFKRFNRVGLIAEELINVIPEVVSRTTDENGNEIPDGIDYVALVPYLLKTIQVQHDDIMVLYEAVTELAAMIGGDE